MLFHKYWFLFMVNIVVLLSLNVESRGGRGSRGGSFGGSIFGNWRKYKKPSNNNQNDKSRRIVSSSPMHTPLTKSLAETHKSNNYPVSLFKRKLSEYNKYRNRHQLPPGGSYFNDLDRIPQNAVFVSQIPPRSSEAINFLASYLGFTLGWHSVLHQQQQQQQHNNNNPTMAYNLKPFNHMQNITYTRKLIINNRHNESLPLVATADVANLFNPIEESYNQTTTAAAAITAATTTATKQQMNNLTAPWGVICINMKFNSHKESENIETDHTNIMEKLICYPAPPPTTSANDVPPLTNSYHSNNLYKHVRTTKAPKQVAGDIIEAN